MPFSGHDKLLQSTIACFAMVVSSPGEDIVGRAWQARTLHDQCRTLFAPRMVLQAKDCTSLMCAIWLGVG